jgi:hypothetical protein
MLLLDDLVFVFVFNCHLGVHNVLLAVVHCLQVLHLFGFLLLAQEDCFLNFLFLTLSLPPHGHNPMLVFFPHHLLHPHLLHLLLNSILILSFQVCNFCRPLLGFFNLFPGFHLFLLKKRYSVR